MFPVPKEIQFSCWRDILTLFPINAHQITTNLMAVWPCEGSERAQIRLVLMRIHLPFLPPPSLLTSIAAHFNTSQAPSRKMNYCCQSILLLHFFPSRYLTPSISPTPLLQPMCSPTLFTPSIQLPPFHLLPYAVQLLSGGRLLQYLPQQIPVRSTYINTLLQHQCNIVGHVALTKRGML